MSPCRNAIAITPLSASGTIIGIAISRPDLVLIYRTPDADSQLAEIERFGNLDPSA